MSYRPLDHLDHSLLSPSGRLSKRSKKAATERLASQLFGPEYLFEVWRPLHTQLSEKANTPARQKRAGRRIDRDTDSDSDLDIFD